MRQSVAPLAPHAPLGAHLLCAGRGSGPLPALVGRYRSKIVRFGTSPKQRIFAVAWGCLRGSELPRKSVRRTSQNSIKRSSTIYLPRTPVNKGSKPLYVGYM